MLNRSRSKAKSVRLSFEALESRTVLAATSPFDSPAELISSHDDPATETDFVANEIKSAANDPFIKKQYGLEITQTDLAWDLTTGSTEVTVAVIDTGVDYLHPDLYLNIWINQQEIPPLIRPLLTDIDGDELVTFWDLNDPMNVGPTTITDLNGTGYIDGGDLLFSIDAGGWADGNDNGQNGFVDDLVGWDFSDNDNDPRGPWAHGTKVAGVIGGLGNNDLGVAGVNWRVQMMPVKIAADANRFITAEAVSPAIHYAVDNDARISNNSYGDLASNLPPEIIAAASEALDYAAAHDHLIVASAGNSALDNDIALHLPSGYDAPNIISVAATDRLDRLAKFSNFGAASVDLGAPGVGIWTTSLNGKYAKVDGTSFASPHVAGAAALILSLSPDRSSSEVKSLILDNVEPVLDLASRTVTGGRLNVLQAVAAATSANFNSLAGESSAGDVVLGSARTATLLPFKAQNSPVTEGDGFQLVSLDRRTVASPKLETLDKAFASLAVKDRVPGLKADAPALFNAAIVDHISASGDLPSLLQI